MRRLEDFPSGTVVICGKTSIIAVAVLRLRARMLVLDQPLIGIPVVKVVVPGLRHSGRHAAGRLFDVPVRMGWLEQPLQENEQPDSLFFTTWPFYKLRQGVTLQEQNGDRLLVDCDGRVVRCQHADEALKRMLGNLILWRQH